MWLYSNAEPVRLLLRPRHAVLMIALPDLRPRPAEDVRRGVLEGVARRHRRGVTLHRETLRNAFHDRKRLDVAVATEPVEMLDDAQGLDERLRVVEHDLLRDADQGARGIRARRVDLDRLEFVAELESAVRDPPLDIRRPGDERVAVPESDRFAQPLRDVRPEPRHDAG